MHNKQIEIFVRVADSGSFSKAADAMFLSSVAVMKQINLLEQRLGVKLLNRTKHGISLTPAGQLFYEDSRKIIAMSQRCIRNVRTVVQPKHPVIRIGTSPMRPYHILSEFNLKELPFRYEIVPFRDKAVRDLFSVPALFGKEIDCIVGFCTPSMEEKYSILPIKKAPYRIAVPSGHRLAGKACLFMEDLYGQTLWIVERGWFPGADALREIIAAEHPQIEIRDYPVTGSTFGRFNEAVRTNSLLLSFDIWSELHPAIVTLPISLDTEVFYGLIYPKDPPEKTQAFVSALRQSIFP